MLAAVVHKQHASVAELDVALRTPLQCAIRPRVRGQDAGVPVRALHRPGDDVLEPAEDRDAFPGLLRRPKAFVSPNGDSAPAAALTRHAREPSDARSLAAASRPNARRHGRSRPSTSRSPPLPGVHPWARVPSRTHVPFSPITRRRRLARARGRTAGTAAARHGRPRGRDLRRRWRSRAPAPPRSHRRAPPPPRPAPRGSTVHRPDASHATPRRRVATDRRPRARLEPTRYALRHPPLGTEDPRRPQNDEEPRALLRAGLVRM